MPAKPHASRMSRSSPRSRRGVRQSSRAWRSLGTAWSNQFHVWASSCDGRSFAAAGELVRPGTWVTQQRNYLIHIFDATTEKFVRSLDDVKSMTSQIAFAPDNRRLATAGWDGAIVIWDATTGKRLRDLPGHRGSVSSLAFSPDGKRLASGSIDTTVLIWDASEPRPAGK